MKPLIKSRRALNGRAVKRQLQFFVHGVDVQPNDFAHILRGRVDGVRMILKRGVKLHDVCQASLTDPKAWHLISTPLRRKK